MRTHLQLEAQRATVQASYDAAIAENNEKFANNDPKATSEYIYENQKQDAEKIIALLVKGVYAVSISKKTKVGMDGLMIEIAKLALTHPDDNFILDRKNSFILTGMSCIAWETDMKDKSPSFLKNNIYHHGQLKNAPLKNLKNSLVQVDEFDTATKEFLRLHNVLSDAGLLNINYIKENNIRFIFASATLIKELYQLDHWGDLHAHYKMTIPASYIGHKDFLDLGIIQPWYPLTNLASAEKWVVDDIVQNYGTDYRVSIVRTNNKNKDYVETACKKHNVKFIEHNSEDRLSSEDEEKLFVSQLNSHVVLAVKGFYRRAVLIPNQYKIRIGATHELYKPNDRVDYNTEIQAKPGRMSGYWRNIILNNEGEIIHKTGPHRTSIAAIECYEKVYNDPFGLNSFQTSTFKKKNGVVKKAKPSLISPMHIIGLEENAIIPFRVADDPHNPQTVPFVFVVTPEQYATIVRIANSNKWDTESICKVIAIYNPNLVAELNRIKHAGGEDQTIEPNETATTYNVYITEFVKASQGKYRRFHQGNIENKNIDKSQIYLDKINKRVIVSLYYGTKLPTPTPTPTHFQQP